MPHDSQGRETKWPGLLGVSGCRTVASRGAASMAAHHRRRALGVKSTRVRSGVPLLARRGETCIRSWGLTTNRDRAERFMGTGPASDGSRLATCMAALPWRAQRRKEDRRETTVGQRGDYRHTGACCQEIYCPDRRSRSGERCHSMGRVLVSSALAARRQRHQLGQIHHVRAIVLS